MSIEEKYDEIRQLITIGKEKGYLLYDEVNELLPADITSSEELDDLFSTFGSAGIEVVDSEKSYRDDKLQGEGGEEGDLDLTPGALDKTNDPVRMYLREMGTVPLLTREGEVAIAKRIEQGKLAVIKSISRTPKVTQEVIEMGEQLGAASARCASSWSSTKRRSPTRRLPRASASSCKQVDRVKVQPTSSASSNRSTATCRRPKSASTARPAGRSCAPRSNCPRSSGRSSSPRWSSAA